jgi:hypothetical protein
MSERTEGEGSEALDFATLQHSWEDTLNAKYTARTNEEKKRTFDGTTYLMIYRYRMTGICRWRTVGTLNVAAVNCIGAADVDFPGSQARVSKNL